MHNTVKNLLDIDNNIKVYLNKLNINNNTKIVAVSKTFKIDKINPLIDHGHIDFGENKIQEAIECHLGGIKEDGELPPVSFRPSFANTCLTLVDVFTASIN